jgi:hypothetical protein
MKSLAFLDQADHNRKAAIYAAAHDGKMRNFAYQEELGECRDRTLPSIVFPAGQEGKTRTCLGWDDGKNYWMSWRLMGLASKAAGARFPRNQGTGSPARSNKRTRWPRKPLPP